MDDELLLLLCLSLSKNEVKISRILLLGGLCSCSLQFSLIRWSGQLWAVLKASIMMFNPSFLALNNESIRKKNTRTYICMIGISMEERNLTFHFGPCPARIHWGRSFRELSCHPASFTGSKQCGWQPVSTVLAVSVLFIHIFILVWLYVLCFWVYCQECVCT